MAIFGAIVTGMFGSIVLILAVFFLSLLGLPKLDFVDLFGTMIYPTGNRALGWLILLGLGSIFSIIYAAIWWAEGVWYPSIWTGILFGTVQWTLAGLFMSIMPLVHAGIKAGTVIPPGIYMMESHGPKAIVTGWISHVAYGVTVALLYPQFLLNPVPA